MYPKSRGITWDAFSTPGRYPAGLSYPGTKRYYYLYGMWPPRDVFVRERDLCFTAARERDSMIRAGTSLCGHTGFRIYHGTTERDYPESCAILRDEFRGESPEESPCKKTDFLLYCHILFGSDYYDIVPTLLGKNVLKNNDL